MTLKISLTESSLEPLEIDGVLYRFKERLTREELANCLRKTGRSTDSTEVISIRRLAKKAIESIEGIEVEKNGKTYGPEPITNSGIIADIMDSPSLPEEHYNGVLEHVMKENNLGEDEGNF